MRVDKCLILSLIYCMLQRDVTTEKCLKSNRAGHEEWFCCDNHEEFNGTCRECSSGFYSDHGERCHPCFTGTYGLKCGEICQCSTQRCNHVLGCVDGFNNLSKSVTFSDGTFHPSKESGILTQTLEQFTNNHITVTASTPFSITGLLKREIIIYSVGIGFVLVVASLGFILLYRCKQNTIATNSHQINIVHTETHQQNADLDSSQFMEGIYETIDETNMIEYQVPLNSGNNYSDSEEFPDRQNNDGYINPYQSMTSNLDAHEYSAALNDSSQLKSVNNSADGCAELEIHESSIAVTGSHDYLNDTAFTSPTESSPGILNSEDLETRGNSLRHQYINLIVWGEHVQRDNSVPS